MQHIRLVSLGVLIGAALLCVPRGAAAQTQVFTERGAFTAVAGQSLSCVDFENLADGDSFETLSLPGVLFRSTQHFPVDLMVLGPESAPLPQIGSHVLLSNLNFNPLVIEFSNEVTAVGLDVISVPDVGTAAGSLLVTVEFSGGSLQEEIPLLSGGPSFVGFVSTSPISRVTVSNIGGFAAFIAVDDVCYGVAPTAPPEPDTPERCLQALSSAIATGRADGTITGLGSSLESKIAATRRALARNDAVTASQVLLAFVHQVEAQRGKHIAEDRAAELIDLARRCLALLEG